MACACKVNRQISYLQKKYGVEGKKSSNKDMTGSIEIIAKSIIVYAVCILLIPVFIISILFRLGKPIDLNKVVDNMINPFKRK